MYGPFDGECEEKEGEVVSKPMMQAMLRAGTALLVGGALAYSTSAMAQFPSFKLKNPPQTSASQKSGKRINIKQMRIVNGRLVLVGYDNKPGKPRRGRYRVVINGFSVRHETWDHAFEVDGKRDEVYVVANVTSVDRKRKIRLSSPAETKVMGDINGHHGRVRAGTASAKGGGIRTGDEVPYKQPWKRRVGPKSDRLPLDVWEGDLIEGQNSVVIMPAIWEYDGGTDVYRSWLGWAKKTARKLRNAEVINKLLGEEGQVVFDLSELGLGVALSLQEDGILGNAKDRPIGMKKQGKRAIFSPKALVLNYKTAEYALKQNFGGRGRGVLAINYKDHPDFAGDYTMYIQIQRIR